MLDPLDLSELDVQTALSNVEDEIQLLSIMSVIQYFQQTPKDTFTMDCYQAGVRYLYTKIDDHDYLLKIRDKGANGRPELLRIASHGYLGKIILINKWYATLFFWFGHLDDFEFLSETSTPAVYEYMSSLPIQTPVTIVSYLDQRKPEQYIYIEGNLILVTEEGCYDDKRLYTLHEYVPLNLIHSMDEGLSVKIRETRRKENRYYWDVYNLVVSKEYVESVQPKERPVKKRFMRNYETKEPMHIVPVVIMPKAETAVELEKEVFLCSLCGQNIDGNMIRSECNKGHLDYFHKACWNKPCCTHNEFHRCLKYYHYIDGKLEQKVKIPKEKKKLAVQPAAVMESRPAITVKEEKLSLTGWKDVDVSCYEVVIPKKAKKQRKQSKKVFLDLSQPINQEANKAWRDLFFHLDPNVPEFVPNSLKIIY